MRSSPFPYNFFASANAFLASLHSSLNQGAKVFPHLFGFFGYFISILFTTPACTAYCTIYSSTAAALSSLFLSVDVISVSSAFRKSVFCVNACQDFAEFA
jgi:hypothetical protein